MDATDMCEPMSASTYILQFFDEPTCLSDPDSQAYLIPTLSSIF